MYTKVLMILLLYGYITGEDDGGSLNGTQLKTDNKSYTFPNYTEGFKVLSLHSTQNNRHSDVRKTFDPEVAELVTTGQKDDYNEFNTKGDLWPDEYVEGEAQVPLFFASIGDFINDKGFPSFENDNSSEFIQADGTYDMPHYVHPAMRGNQYHMQQSPSYSNWQQRDFNFRNNPCTSNSDPYQYMQTNHYNRRPYSEYDAYQAQGTYNIQYYVPPYQQMNQYPVQHPDSSQMWRRREYISQPFVDPCRPQILPPSPNRGTHTHPYPNPPKHRNTYSYASPPQIYNNFPLSQNRYIHQAPPESFFYPPPPPKGPYIPPTRKTETTTKWVHTPPVWPPWIPNRTKSHTPIPPPHEPPGKKTTPAPPPWTTSRIRTKSPTPATPPWKTPSIRTTGYHTPRVTHPWKTPSSRTKSHTPATPPWKTPSIRTTGYYTPTVTRPWKTPSSRTKSHTPTPPWYTPITRKPNGWRITPPTKPSRRRTKGY